MYYIQKNIFKNGNFLQYSILRFIYACCQYVYHADTEWKFAGNKYFLKQTAGYTSSAADEAQEEMQPELAAAVMHTEEKGMAMAAPPNQMYNYLFPDSEGDPIIGIR